MRRTFPLDHRMTAPHLSFFIQKLGALVLCLASLPIADQTHAQIPITKSGLNTQVSEPLLLPTGQTQFNITGGTRPNNGTNLFHSFGEFSVPPNNIANFLNETALPTSNILGRVTGGNISNIFGAIQTTGFGNANLFLMNPAGFLFGPNATVNVGGMVTFASADYLRLADNARFNAVPGPADLLLTAEPVAAFGFLGSTPGAITVQGSRFTVTEGTGISLAGGNITIESGILEDGTIQPAHMTAPGGQINLASVKSAGEVSADDFMSASGMMRGDISLSQEALLDVSANAAGTIRIRGGQLTINNATVSADSIHANESPTAIDVQISGDLKIVSDRAPAFTARTFGAGNAGNIELVSGSLTSSSLPDGSTSFSTIESYTLGSGNGGNVHVVTGELKVSTDPLSIPTFLIDSGTGGEGNGGNITIESAGAIFSNTGINTGDSFLGGSGSAGNISLKSDSLVIEASTFAADSFSARGGDMLLEARDITVSKNSFLDVLSLEGESKVRITADHLTVDDASSILNQTALGPGGGIDIMAKTVDLTNNSQIISQTFGDGDAGSIHVTATDHVTVADIPELGGNPSGFYTNSFGNAGLGVLGKAGNIEIIAPRLTLEGGTRINSTTQSSGRGGDVNIVSEEVILFGQRTLDVDSEFFGLGGTKATGIYTRTVGSEFCSGVCGDAGNVSITTGSLRINAGAVVDSGTTGTGNGGTIEIIAADHISIAGKLVDGTPGGVFSRTIGTVEDSGNSGNIVLRSPRFELKEGANVSASTTGTGNAGSITIQGLTNQTQSILIDGPGSGVFTDTQGTGAGGAITVNANTITLDNQATISANTTGAGNAGTITLEADNKISLLGNASILNSTDSSGNGGFVLLHAPTIDMQNGSNIVASTAGAGNAGNIDLQANQVNLTESFITARTQAEGRGGNITIRGLTGEGSHSTDVTFSNNSQLVSETIGDGVNTQGVAGNIRVDTARLNLSGASLFNTASRGSTGAAGNIVVNATDSVTISGVGTQLFSGSTEFSFGDAGHIAVTAPSVAVENGGRISTVTSLVGNAGTITVDTNNLQLLSGGQITSSSLVEFQDFPPSGAAGTVTVQGLASPAQSVLIDGTGSGIFTDTQGTGAGGNIVVHSNTVMLQNGGTLSATTTGTAPSANGGTITVDASNTVTMSGDATITANSSGAADAGSINITALNGLSMHNSAITTQVTPSADSNAGGGNIKITTSPEATVLIQNSMISASVADGPGGGGNISIDPQFVILQNSQILAQAAQGQGGAITIVAGLFLPDSTSVVNADSGSGLNGNITIQSPNSPASGKILPLSNNPLIATTLLSQRCAALTGGNISSFTMAGRESLPAEPGSWLSAPLPLAGYATYGEPIGPATRAAASGLSNGMVSLRQIGPRVLMAQGDSSEWTGCGS